MTTPRKYTGEQIVAILQEHQGGVTAKEIIWRHGIALDTFYRWKRTASWARRSCSGSRRSRARTDG